MVTGPNQGTSGPLNKFFLDRPELLALFQALGPSDIQNDHRLILGHLSKALALSLSLPAFRCVSGLDELLVNISSGLDAGRIRATPADSSNPFAGHLRDPDWHIVGFLGHDLTSPNVRLSGSCFKTLILMSAVYVAREEWSLDQSINNKINMVKVLNKKDGIRKASNTFRHAYTAGAEMELSDEALLRVTEIFKKSVSIRQALRKIREIQVGKDNAHSLMPGFHGACEILDLCLPPSFARHVNQLETGSFSFLQMPEGADVVETFQLFQVEGASVLLPVGPAEQIPQGEKESIDDEGVQLNTVGGELEADENFEDQIQKAVFISDRALGQLLQMYEINEYSREIFNEVEREWLTEYLFESINGGIREALPACFIALSISLSMSSGEIANLKLGAAGDILSPGYFRRVIPKIPNAAHPWSGSGDRYYEHTNEIVLAFPEITKRLVEKCLFYEPKENIKECRSLGYSADEILAYIKSGMQHLRDQYGNRYHTRRVERQLRYFSVIKTRNVSVVQLMFRKPNEGLATGGHYLYTPSETVVRLYSEIAKDYFVRAYSS